MWYCTSKVSVILLIASAFILKIARDCMLITIPIGTGFCLTKEVYYYMEIISTVIKVLSDEPCICNGFCCLE